MAGMQLVFEISCYISYPYNLLFAKSVKVDKTIRLQDTIIFLARYLNLENIPLPH